MSLASIRIGERDIGPGRPTYLIAEMSGNHNRSYERAVALLRAAVDAGADAVKLQTYTADTMTLDLDDDVFRISDGGLWHGRTLHDLYNEASMPWDWQPLLFAEAEKLGIELFSTPFDDTAVAFLETIGVRAYKIASFEIVDLPLIARVARTGKPLVMSTGMATLAEIQAAVETADRSGAREILLMRCTSEYPASPGDMDLASIPHLASAFGLPVGLSDHTLGLAAPIAAVALGACAVEKHFTLRRSDGGPDAAFSLEPEELATLVRELRVAEQLVGEVRYGPARGERANALFRRSLFVVEDVAAGDALTSQNVRAIRPGSGLSPRWTEQVIGRRARKNIQRGTPLDWELIS